MEKLTVTLVPSVIRQGIACQESSHESGNTRGSTSDEEMGVIGHECPCVALGLCFRDENRKPLNEVFTIFIIIEYPAALYSSDHNMMQEAGNI